MDGKNLKFTFAVVLVLALFVGVTVGMGAPLHDNSNTGAFVWLGEYSHEDSILKSGVAYDQNKCGDGELLYFKDGQTRFLRDDDPYYVNVKSTDNFFKLAFKGFTPYNPEGDNWKFEGEKPSFMDTETGKIFISEGDYGEWYSIREMLLEFGNGTKQWKYPSKLSEYQMCIEKGTNIKNTYGPNDPDTISYTLKE